MKTWTTLALLAAMFPAMAAAQDDLPGGAPTGEAPTALDPGLPTGQPVAPEASIEGTFGDWEIRCLQLNGDGELCSMYQLLFDGAGNAVAEVTLFDIADAGGVVAGATIVTPLETLLRPGIRVSVDGGNAQGYPFTFCAPTACYAQIGLTSNDIAAFRAGNAATLQIVPLAAPDQAVNLQMSLSGFTAGFADLGTRPPAPAPGAQ